MKALFQYWTRQAFFPGKALKKKYRAFRSLLSFDKAAHEHMARLEEVHYQSKPVDFEAVIRIYADLSTAVAGVVDGLLKMNPARYTDLKAYFRKFDFYVRFMLEPPEISTLEPFTIWSDKVSEHDEFLCGGKAHSLYRLSELPGILAPQGFVITTRAYHLFMVSNHLTQSVNTVLADLDIHDHKSLTAGAVEIQEMIMAAHVPEDVVNAITQGCEKLKAASGKPLKLAVRSSAVMEDGNLSFAGIYPTRLNVARKDILEAYKAIIAGRYAAKALYYRIANGILDSQTPMAVGVMEMVDSKQSGIIYTGENSATHDHLTIYAVQGQGFLLASGEIQPDLYKIDKNRPDTILERRPGSQSRKMVLDAGGCTRRVDIDAKSDLILSKKEAAFLAHQGLMLEKYFGNAQDIEWCRGPDNQFYILQSRPLHPAETNHSKGPELKAKETFYHDLKPLFSGETVCPGAGAGPVFKLDSIDRITDIPKGAVLAVRHGATQLISAIEKLSAIIIQTGSFAGHFSSIAREFNIPTLTNAEDGFERLKSGDTVTVDASRGKVFKGRLKGLAQRENKKAIPYDSLFKRKLQYVINFTVPLRLTHPDAENFKPQGVRSLHDILRFAHETAVREMFSISSQKDPRKKGARKLMTQLPLNIYVLDLDNGTRPLGRDKKTLQCDDITCRPFTAVLKGLTNKGICWTETTHFDWDDYDRAVMAGGIISPDSHMYGTYAVLAKNYMNVNFRFGYHFTIVDALCTPRAQNNYIYFRFAGGGGQAEGRFLRGRFIKAVLTRLGFTAQVKSDLIDAELKHCSQPDMAGILDRIGRLLGATKIMDMYIKPDQKIEQLADAFMAGRYDFRPLETTAPSLQEPS